MIGIKSYYGASGSRKKKRWQDKIKWRQSVTTQRGLWNRVFLPSVKYSWERVKRNMFYKMQERNQYNKCQCGKPTTFFFLLSYLSKVNNFIWKTVCYMNSAWKDWIFHPMKPNCAVAAYCRISTLTNEKVALVGECRIKSL